MEPIQEPNDVAVPLSRRLGPGRLLSQERAIHLLQQVTRQVQLLHEEGRFHGAIDADCVLLDSGDEPRLAPAPSSLQVGGDDSDLEFSPPELADVAAVEIPSKIEEATTILARHGQSFDPRRIDVYQLGTLLCRLLSGESVVAYLYDAEVKQRIPSPLREVLEQALGFDPDRRFANGSELLQSLDGLAPQVLQETAPRSSDETPAHGSILVPGGDTSVDEHVPAPAPAGDLPFSQLGHFQIVGRIGRGGMGDVYQGYDEMLRRHVAVKVLPHELARDEDFVRRFRAEAAAAANISHPNIVPVHFIGEDAGHHFFAMQFIDGMSLAQCLEERGRLPVAEVARIADQCLAGLGAAHDQGLIHRDVKPGNVLLDREASRAVLVDFGLVRQIDRATRMTITGTIMGTVDYMAPEQARGQSVDGRADIYALGVVLYQLLSGRLPFQAETAAVMIFQHAYEPPFPLDQAAPDAPEPLRAIVARMMAKDPADRYASCQEVLDDLRAWRAGQPIAASTMQAGRGDRETTVVLPAPAPDEDLESPADLERLAAQGPLGGLRDWAATMFRRHAPELIKELQSTTQWTDGAVAEYERRSRRLERLLAEAKVVYRGLEEQLQSNREALATALREAETADEAARQSAVERQKAYEDSVETLSRHSDDQKRQIAEIELQLSKTHATLARLRSQRDLLKARLKSAEAGQSLESSPRRKPRTRNVQLVFAILTGSLLLLFVTASLLLLAGRFTMGTPRFNYQAPYMDNSMGVPQLERRVQPVPVLSEAELQGKVLTNSIGMKLIQIPAGEFMMGTDKVDFDVLATSDEARPVFNEEYGPNETPSHEVVISNDYHMGVFEVTQGQYKQIMFDNPSMCSGGLTDLARNKGKHDPSFFEAMKSGKYDNHPVDSVSFEKAQEFCRKLSQKPEELEAGRVYRLPTEAEWERACRAGTGTAFSFGLTALAGDFNFGNSVGTKIGGSFRSNAFGLYDMHGNVWEWVADAYDPKYYATSPRIDPKCVRGTEGCLMRGGSFADPSIACRSAFRGVERQFSFGSSIYAGFPVGFRVVCTSSTPNSP